MRANQKFFLVSIAIGLAAAGPVFPHAAEQGFVLLLPTKAYISAGTLAVAATMLLLAFVKPGQLAKLLRPFDTRLPGHWLAPPPFVAVIGSLCLALLIYVGLVGPSDPQANLLPLALWTVWWMAMFIVQGLVFDIWRWINPWPGLHRLICPDDRPILTLPPCLSAWPAMVIFIAFQGFVLADVAPNDPDRLARFALGYWAFTFLGMTVFGRGPWLRQVECFTVLFNLIGLLRCARARDTLEIGLPGWQAFEAGGIDPSRAVLVLVMLAAGSFDGLHETFWWLHLVGVNPLEFPGRSAMVWKTSLGLYGGVAFLILVFTTSVWIGLMALDHPRKEQRPVSISFAFKQFSMTLLPIAIGYHFAHYFVTFLVQIQYVVANFADPLAAGWNLFGLGGTRVKVGFLTVPEIVKVIWITQAGIVVISHVLAVVMSHRTAEILCSNRRDIVRIQLGLSVLMVAYTLFGLWLLASPRGA